MFRAWVVALGTVAIVSASACSSNLARVAPGAAPTPVARSSSAPRPEPKPPLAETEPAVQTQDPVEPADERTGILEPTAIACRIREKAWSHPVLRLRAGGPAFANVEDAPATLLLPSGDTPTEAIAVIDDGKILLRAVIERSEVRIHLPKPTALSGIVTLAAHTSLEWVSASDGKLRARYADVADVLLTPSPFEVELGCGAVVIEARDYDARASITRRQNLPTRETARDGVELRATQKGPVAATLRADVGVEVLEMRGADARILIDEVAHLITGWVPRKDLVPAPGGAGLGLGGMGGGGRGTASPPFTLRCPGAIDLYVEQGTDRIKVGSVYPGTDFYPRADAPPKDHFVPISIWGSDWLWLHRDVRFAVEESSIRACTKH